MEAPKNRQRPNNQLDRNKLVFYGIIYSSYLFSFEKRKTITGECYVSWLEWLNNEIKKGKLQWARNKVSFLYDNAPRHTLKGNAKIDWIASPPKQFSLRIYFFSNWKCWPQRKKFHSNIEVRINKYLFDAMSAKQYTKSCQNIGKATLLTVVFWKE